MALYSNHEYACVWQQESTLYMYLLLLSNHIQQISYIPQTEQHLPFRLVLLCLWNM